MTEYRLSIMSEVRFKLFWLWFVSIIVSIDAEASTEQDVHYDESSESDSKLENSLETENYHTELGIRKSTSKVLFQVSLTSVSNEIEERVFNCFCNS